MLWNSSWLVVAHVIKKGLSVMNDSIKLFRTYYADLLIPNGFIFRDGKFVRVIPNVGAIFVYFKSRKTIHDILVSVVSFAQQPVSIQELIRNNDVHIWTLRRKFINYRFQYDSIYEFLIQSLYIFKQSVYPEIVKISNAKDILTFYVNLIKEYSIDDTVWYYDVRIAAAMQSHEYGYVLETTDILEKHLRRKLNQDHEFDDVFNGNLSRRNDNIEFRLKDIKLIRDIIHNNDTYYICQLLNRRITYWDNIFNNRYTSFYK